LPCEKATKLREVLTSLQALLRLATLRWLGVFVCALATLLSATSTASALQPAQTKTRVWGFDFAEHKSVGLFRAASSGKHQGNRLARAEAASGSLLAARAGAGASKVLGQTPRNLQKFFGKHGSDFGLSGNWNPSRAADASRVINQHINSPGVRAIEGAYRGNPATHFLDPKTGLNVVADPAGNFVTGYRLGAEQLQGVLTTGHLF
jgi:hypothetical protein